MSEVVLLLGAEIEIQAVYTRLAEISPDRAAKFDATIQAALRQLSDYPFSGRIYLAHLYRLVLSAYPYALFYSVESNRVFVHWLLDTRQHPEAIRRRLGF